MSVLSIYFGILFSSIIPMEPDTIVVNYSGDTIVKEVYLAKINSRGDTIRSAFIIRFTEMDSLTKGGITEKINSRGNGYYRIKMGLLSRS